MAMAGAAAARTRYTRTHASLAAAVRARRRYKSSTQKKKKQNKQPTLVCSWNMFVATCVALSIFVTGIALCLIGYHATDLMGVKANSTEKPQFFKDKLPEDEYLKLQILYNLRFAGPVIMGMGGFVMLCVCVLMYNEKDRIENGESTLISSDDDIYQKAIQDYFDREELNNRRFEELGADDDRVKSDSDLLSQSVSLSSSLAKFGSLLIAPNDGESPSKHSINSETSNQKQPLHFIPLSVPKIRQFKLDVRNCSSDSEDINHQHSNSILVRQSTNTTCSSSPTLCNVSDDPTSEMITDLTKMTSQQLCKSNHSVPNGQKDECVLEDIASTDVEYANTRLL